MFVATSCMTDRRREKVGEGGLTVLTMQHLLWTLATPATLATAT